MRTTWKAATTVGSSVAMLTFAQTARGATADTAATTSLSLAQVAVLIAGGIAVMVVVVLYVRSRAASHASQLSASNDRQQALIEAIPDALFRMDADGRFTEFKPSTEFAPAYAPDEFLGKTIQDLDLPAEMVIHWEAARESVRREGGHRIIEYQLDYPDGPHDFEARIVQVGPVEYLGMVRDISARKQAEADSSAYRRQLEQTVTRRTADLIEANVRLQEANRAKSVFLASMSHELRTPLNSIIGFTDIMLKGLAGEVNEEQHRQLTMVRQAGRQLLCLVDDVLDYTRIESGRVTALPADFRLSTLLGECLTHIRSDAQIKGLGIELDVGRVPATMHSDRRLLEQVLLQLLTNAVKFTEAGTITLSAHSVDDDHVMIEIRDSGVGIDPGLREDIFHAFAQGPGHASAKPQGLGLGLSICYELTRLLGGTIELSQNGEQGTVARLTLPVHLESPTVSATEPES